MNYRPRQPIPGTQYRFLCEIGAGGHGTVYAVEHTFLEAPAVMKLLHAELVDRGDLTERMTREAKTLAKLRHPNIVEVRDGGITAEAPSRPYFVMEALSGMPLRELLRHVRGSRGVGVIAALRILIDVLEGLEHAHRAGVIHRDIKPDNIFLHRTATDVTVPKILDFGIAHLLMGQRTTGRYFLGTPRYAAPEQLRGDSPTARTDLYAAGLVLHEMLTGEPPFPHLREVGELMQAHMGRPLPPVTDRCPEAPPELARFLEWMIEKDPDKRPPTAFAAAVGLREIRAKIEAQKAGALHATDFRTEPTPMTNMLVGVVPDDPALAPTTPGTVSDTVVDPQGDGPAPSPAVLRTTVRASPRGLAAAPRAPSATTDFDPPRGTPQAPPATPPMGARGARGAMGSVDRSAETNTAAPIVPPSRPNYDTERLLGDEDPPVSATASSPTPSGVGGERTTGVIAMSRNTSAAAVPKPMSPFAKQAIAFALTLVVFGVISVPVLWKLKKDRAARVESAATTELAAAAASQPPSAVSAVPPAQVSAPPAAATASPREHRIDSEPAPAPERTAKPALAPAKPAAATAATKPAPSPRKPKVDPNDPSTVGFD